MNTSMIRKASKQHTDVPIDEDLDEQSASVDDETAKISEQQDTNNESMQSSSITSSVVSVEQNPLDEDSAKKIKHHNQPIPASIKGPDNQTLLRLLEEGEELQSMFRCARINGLDTSEGLLLFGKEHYYVVDGFTLLKTKEIRDLDFLPEE